MSRPASPPAAVEPLPSPEQLAWQELEYYAFVHFNMNTFTDMEWGYGDEPASSFNPTELDTRQWARVAKEAGMKGIILTAKHHDGFSLWPTAYSEHSVKNSPWKDGQGDVVAELAEACKEYGLKMGIYLSPWDRNHAQYGNPEYVTYYRNQVKELLTNYGDIFEFWVDGANGGDGYYGGANETRNVDRTTYYDWDSTFALVKSLQPEIIIFSDGGQEPVGWATKTDLPEKPIGRALEQSNLLRELARIKSHNSVMKMEPIGCQQRPMFLFVRDGITMRLRMTK